MIKPVSFATTSAAVSKVRADLLAQGYTGTVLFGKQYRKQHRDPTAGGSVFGSVVVVPIGRSPLNAPRLNGGNPAPTFTVARTLEIYCWSKAPIGSFLTQYEADLTAAEILTASVLRSFEVYVPGAKRGGTSDVVDAGENTFGVEVMSTISIDLELPNTTYQLATGAVFVPSTLMEFPDGHTESGSDP
jgi:hypothetical protein